MKNRSVGKNITLAILGFVLLILGIALLIWIKDVKGILLTLPYIFIGVGAGLFGGNLGTVMMNNRMKNDPAVAKQVEIESRDERNIAIHTKAKAKAYDLMIIVFSVLILIFSLMRVDVIVILSLISAYIFVMLSVLFYMNKYSKEM